MFASMERRASSSSSLVAPEPKRLELLEGAGHAQNMFKTPQGAALTKLIVQFFGDR